MSGTLTAPPRLKLRAAPLAAVDDYQVAASGEINAYKVIRADDPYLEGHYPDFTIYPGVFIIESVVQTVRLLAQETLEDADDLELAEVCSVRFTNPMLPGDTLRIRCECKPGADGMLQVKAECRTGGDAKAAQMKLVFRKGAAARIPTAAPAEPSAVLYDHAHLRGMLPHRHPILLVDTVEKLTPYGGIVASKAVTGSEPCYAGLTDAGSDDPRRYAYPRSLTIESFGQSGAVLWLESIRREGRELDGSLIFAAARDVTFHRQAHPGDVLRHEAELDQIVGDNAFLHGRTLIGDQVAVEYGSCIAVVRQTETLGS